MWGYDTSRMVFSKWLIPQETMDSKRKNMFAPTRTFAIEITHPNIIYLSQGDERKHSLYVAILTLGFRI